MRKILAGLVLLTAACATVPPQKTAHFRILQINDVYKIEGLENGNAGGLARIRTLRNHLGSDGTPVLVLHGGDTLYPSVMSKYLQARPMVSALNLLDGDANATDPHLLVVFGNHELDNSTDDILIARLKESQFRWLGTNVRRCSAPGNCTQPYGELAPSVHDRVMLDVDAIRVGLFGVLLPTTKKYATTTDVQAAARDSVAKLRADGARIVIALTHQYADDDAKLVRDVPGIDLVIGGHDHIFQQQNVNGVWIAKADADAKSVIVYDVVVPPAGAIKAVPVRMTLDETVAKDAAVDAAVQQWMTTLASTIPNGDAVIGRTQYLLEGLEDAVRGRETALGNLLADAARQAMNADVAFVNGGGIRINDNIPPGEITNYDMEGVFYFSNTLVAMNFTGQQLLDTLTDGVARADAGDGRFLQVSGVRFAYRKQGDSFVVSDVTVNGAPLDLAKTYRVATVKYLWDNGYPEGFRIFNPATRPPLAPGPTPDFREVTEAYIKAQPEGMVRTGVEGRIKRVQ